MLVLAQSGDLGICINAHFVFYWRSSLLIKKIYFVFFTNLVSCFCSPPPFLHFSPNAFQKETLFFSWTGFFPRLNFCGVKLGRFNFLTRGVTQPDTACRMIKTKRHVFFFLLLFFSLPPMCLLCRITALIKNFFGGGGSGGVGGRKCLFKMIQAWLKSCRLPLPHHLPPSLLKREFDEGWDKWCQYLLVSGHTLWWRERVPRVMWHISLPPPPPPPKNRSALVSEGSVAFCL